MVSGSKGSKSPKGPGVGRIVRVQAEGHGRSRDGKEAARPEKGSKAAGSSEAGGAGASEGPSARAHVLGRRSRDLEAAMESKEVTCCICRPRGSRVRRTQLRGALQLPEFPGRKGKGPRSLGTQGALQMMGWVSETCLCLWVFLIHIHTLLRACEFSDRMKQKLFTDWDEEPTQSG